MASLHVSISAEPIAYIGNFAVTNSIFTSLLVSFLIIIFAIYANTKITNTKRPSGLQNFLEFIIESFYNLTNDIVQNRAKTKVIFPITTTFFFFILLNNWFGLIPGVGTIGISEPVHIASPDITSEAFASDLAQQTGDQHEFTNEPETEAQPISHELSTASTGEEGHAQAFIPLLRAGTADLNTTIGLAIISMITVQVLGFKYLGLSYLTKFFNLKNPIFAFVGLLELLSEVAKIISFAFRLFGNVFAGEVLLVVIAFLLPLIAPMPFIVLEIFVGFVQALVFTMLSIVFMSVATHGHDDH